MVRNEMIYRKQMKQKKSKAKEKQNIFHFELNGFFKTVSSKAKSFKKVACIYI